MPGYTRCQVGRDSKAEPLAEETTAVFTPITYPAELTNGPPLLPGFNAASVCMISSINLPLFARSVRPNALTTPVVTVCCRPIGLPGGNCDLPGLQYVGVGKLQWLQSALHTPSVQQYPWRDQRLASIALISVPSAKATLIPVASSIT